MLPVHLELIGEITAVCAGHAIAQGASDFLKTLAHDLELAPLVEHHPLRIEKADQAAWVDVRDKTQCIPWPEQEDRQAVLEQRVDDERDRDLTTLDRKFAFQRG